MKKEDRLQDELNEQAPLLNSLRGGGSGLQVPDGYFEELETSVFRQLDALGAKRKPLVSPQTGRTGGNGCNTCGNLALPWLLPESSLFP